jgi:hypothetical protein
MTDAVLYLCSPTSWRVETEETWQGIGSVEECTFDRFFIRATTPVCDASYAHLSGIHTGPYSTLDAAMEAIAAELGGKCTRWQPWAQRAA